MVESIAWYGVFSILLTVLASYTHLSDGDNLTLKDLLIYSFLSVTPFVNLLLLCLLIMYWCSKKSSLVLVRAKTTIAK